MTLLAKIRQNASRHTQYLRTVKVLRDQADDIGISPLLAEEIAHKTVYGW